MPTYVSLIHWTDQGIKNYKDSPSRAADFTKLAESSAAGYANCSGRSASTTSSASSTSPTMKRRRRPYFR